MQCGAFDPSKGVESAILIFRLEYATLLSGVVFTHSAALRSGKQYRAREQHQCRYDERDLAHPPVICGGTAQKKYTRHRQQEARDSADS
jgi:hypothetical protein